MTKEVKLNAGTLRVLRVPESPEIPEANALEYLQSIYRNPLQPDSIRMRAAALAIAFESPKLAVISHIADNGSFADRLDRAIARSNGPPTFNPVIEHQPAESSEE